MRSMSSAWRRLLPWLNLILTGGLILAGVWFLSTRLDLATIIEALSKASVGYTFLSVVIMLATMLLKAVRWQLMFPSERPPVRLSSSFWAISLAQYVNLVVPFVRLGEVARLYALNREAGVSPGRGVGTLVVEKTLDLIFFGLTILFVIPFVVFPDYVSRPGPVLTLLPLILFGALYLVAYQTDLVIAIWRRVVTPFPPRVRDLLLRVAVSGLEGLAALRNRRLSLLMLFLSLTIAGLSIVLPFVLFLALSLPLTFLDAALVHIVVSIAIVPPSTPAKIGVLNGAAALVLWQVGITDEANIAAYTILLYLVVVVPQITVGLIAASRSKWSWQMAVQPSLTTEIETRVP
ncbi:MAG: flippase-like domain-containing protein [Candidatus Promineofilum sp.]|uniref:lysylphosphatidylglycerol synthase transmembrane domain-containing protein n=1 Tax=Promineifilum sp. TaxID=2664178 RepID=UPI002411D67A|nr:flippase-like domain-containing protein [Promineifilum sp.]MCO5179055.1 flippase-like domain-containing protein [Promineifilum sp.]